jgi:hypothetical protein
MVDDVTIVHGDILNSDTRTVLAILEIGEVKYHFKQMSQNTLDNALGGADDLQNLSLHTPLLEDKGTKRLGSGHLI